ncbi:MAG: hypothetical protein KF773_42945, partial [Deltaproteobacteria bacterium]|nr:hypothetical protein [Deltaproteobacteria bacterium]
MRFALACLVVAACGHRPPAGAWLERDARGQSHAQPGAQAPDPDGAALDPRTLDAAKIDALDEATAIA